MTDETELFFYKSFTYNRLMAMGKVYYNGKPSQYQKTKYEQVRTALLAELRSLVPQAKDEGSACYIHAAITSVLDYNNRNEKNLQQLARAAMQTAHNNLLNYDLDKKGN